MRRILDVTTYPGIVVFLIAGLATVGFAFVSFNLFQQAQANLAFLQEHSWLAVMEGGLVQMAVLAVYGLVGLFAFIVFRICESEIVDRYRRWIDRPGK